MVMNIMVMPSSCGLEFLIQKQRKQGARRIEKINPSVYFPCIFSPFCCFSYLEFLFRLGQAGWQTKSETRNAISCLFTAHSNQESATTAFYLLVFIIVLWRRMPLCLAFSCETWASGQAWSTLEMERMLFKVKSGKLTSRPRVCWMSWKVLVHHHNKPPRGLDFPSVPTAAKRLCGAARKFTAMYWTLRRIHWMSIRK